MIRAMGGDRLGMEIAAQGGAAQAGGGGVGQAVRRVFPASKGCGGVRGQGFGSADQGEAPDGEGLARRGRDQAVDMWSLGLWGLLRWVRR